MKGVEFLLHHNHQQVAQFDSYSAGKTAISVLGCMDGRVNLPITAHMPSGSILPWSNLGGKFHLGWPTFGSLMTEWVRESAEAGQQCLVLVSYHFSKGEPHRGCKGFGYDKEDAMAFTKQLVDDFKTLYAHAPTTVYPVQIGLETDEDSLIIHGANGVTLDMATLEPGVDTETALAQLFPDMDKQMVADFAPILSGNLEHIQEIRAAKRPLEDAEHKEWVLAVGRGFEWLRSFNTAFMIGPYSPNLSEPIQVGATLLLDNITSGRVKPDDNGIVLMVSEVADTDDPLTFHWAKKKSAFLADYALNEIRSGVPDLAPHLELMVGVVDKKTRQFHPIELN